MRIFVVGHKSPDVDAISSAIQYAEFLKETEKYEGAEVVPTRAGELNIETKYIFDEYHIQEPKHIDEYNIEPDDQFILVDHNEQIQRHEKVNQQNIIEVIDHHKVNIEFTKPIEIIIQPVGSTSTVIYNLFKNEGIEPTEKIATLILSGILSDTVGLKSSTTTEKDREYATELAGIADIDMEELTFNIFKTKSDIENLTNMEIAEKDFKIYEFGQRKVFINQVETVEPEKIIDKTEDLIKALDKVKEQRECSEGFIVVTDILKVRSQIIYSNENERNIIEKAFNTKGENNVANIGSKISRKKDIAPEIESTIGQLDSS